MDAQLQPTPGRPRHLVAVPDLPVEQREVPVPRSERTHHLYEVPEKPGRRSRFAWSDLLSVDTIEWAILGVLGGGLVALGFWFALRG